MVEWGVMVSAFLAPASRTTRSAFYYLVICAEITRILEINHAACEDSKECIQSMHASPVKVSTTTGVKCGRGSAAE